MRDFKLLGFVFLGAVVAGAMVTDAASASIQCSKLRGSGGEGVATVSRCTPSAGGGYKSFSGHLSTGERTFTWSTSRAATDVELRVVGDGARGACKSKRDEEVIIEGYVASASTTGTGIPAVDEELSARMCVNLKTSKITLVPGTSLTFTLPASTGSWTEHVVPGALSVGFLDSLACIRDVCYLRGVTATGGGSDGIALWASTSEGRFWPTEFILPGPNIAQSCIGPQEWLGCVAAAGSAGYALGPEGATTQTDTTAFWSTTDTGETWTEHTIAPEVTGSWLSCADETHCYILAIYDSHTALLSTANAGASWTAHDVSAESRAEITCPAIGVCMLASPNDEEQAIETTNSGETWHSFGPVGPSSFVSCPSSSVCWLAEGAQIWLSTDSGASWSKAGTLAKAPVELSCLSAKACMAIVPPHGGGRTVLLTTNAARWAEQSLPNLEIAYGAQLTSTGGAVVGLSGGAVSVWSDPDA